ncbi:MAG: glycerate kinase, partial [Chloroflexota bacterium]
DKPNPMRASTYGTGQLMLAALNTGARRFIVGLGGSATVDGGSGALMALGASYLNSAGRPILQGGAGSLNMIESVDLTKLDPRWADCEVIVLTDVDTLAVGEGGAAEVFGPQKGATDADIPVLDANLRQFLTKLATASGRAVLDLAGGGAAGALAAGLASGLGAELRAGADYILEFIGFDDALVNADLVITGEGRMDEQTIAGKGPFGVALRARDAGIPTVALVGSLGVDDQILHEAGLAAILPILDQTMPLEVALRDAPQLLERAALRLGYLLQVH